MYNICQVCGNPMFNLKDMGRNTDGSLNKDYCHNCYTNGHFYRDHYNRKGTLTNYSAIGLSAAAGVSGTSYVGGGYGNNMGLQFPPVVLTEDMDIYGDEDQGSLS